MLDVDHLGLRLEILHRCAALHRSGPAGFVRFFELLLREMQPELDRLRTERARLQEEIATRVNLFSWRDTTTLVRENLASVRRAIAQDAGPLAAPRP